MAGALGDPKLEELIDEVDRSLGALAAHGIEPVDAHHALEVVRRVEASARRLNALQVQLVAEIDRRHLHRADGHRSARAMVGFAANLAPAEAGRRARAARALRDLPEVAAGLAEGRIGRDQVDRIARVHANRRVRAALLPLDADLAVVAARLRYAELDRHLHAWEQLADEDGAGSRSERDHLRRDFTIRQNLDGSYRIEGGCGSLQGTVAAEILEAYVRAELEADWAEARAEHGPDVSIEQLARTDAQRRMDAVERIFLDAAATRAERTGHQIVTNLVIDLPTFERHAARLAGVEPTGPDPRLATFWAELRQDLDATSADGESTCDRPTPGDPGGDERQGGEPSDPSPSATGVGYRCSTVDGTPVHPAEAVAAALRSHVRRVVVGADSVVIDVGRRTRCFTGPRHLAVLLGATTCCWPGCNVPASRCQADHLEPWSQGGRTDPGNGAPTCGKHNRFRNHGFTVERDASGRLHVYRPDGTEIT